MIFLDFSICYLDVLFSTADFTGVGIQEMVSILSEFWSFLLFSINASNLITKEISPWSL